MPCQPSSADQLPVDVATDSLIQFRNGTNHIVPVLPPLSLVSLNEFDPTIRLSPFRLPPPSPVPRTTGTTTSTSPTNINTDHQSKYLLSILDEALDIIESMNLEMSVPPSEELSDSDGTLTEQD